jgi:hypothetical protein
MPQDLICLPSMPPEDAITLENGAGQERQKKVKKKKAT